MNQQNGGWGSSGIRERDGGVRDRSGAASPGTESVLSSIFSAVSPFVCTRALLAHADKALPTAVVEKLAFKYEAS